MSQWYHPRYSLSRDEWETVVDASTPSWQYAGLRVSQLDDADQLVLPPAAEERIVLPLAGSFHVEATSDDGASTGESAPWSTDLAGRASVFAGATDLAYIGANMRCVITGVGRVAVCAAPATMPRPCVHLPAADVPVELRGSGNMSRAVRNFGTPGVLDACSIIACEVVTPGGNWSSYPAHKHDHATPGGETELEEIYYFEFQTESGGPGADATTPFGYQRVLASDDRPIDVMAEVRSGDVVLVPYGWHGPSMAAPGYDMYYLNVMAGPGSERAWRITDHPEQTWLRDTWPDHPVDPRLRAE